MKIARFVYGNIIVVGTVSLSSSSLFLVVCFETSFITAVKSVLLLSSDVVAQRGESWIPQSLWDGLVGAGFLLISFSWYPVVCCSDFNSVLGL